VDDVFSHNGSMAQRAEISQA